MRELCRQRWGHGPASTVRVGNLVLGKSGGLLALDPSHAADASALRIRPMRTVFVVVTAAAIHCRQYEENQVVDHVDAASAWEWRMLNSLAIFTCRRLP